jgi:membrane fusion protein (multidrug efflux system)
MTSVRLTVFIILAALVAGCSGEGDKQLPVPRVTVYKVEPQEVPLYMEFVGEVFGAKDIAIRARVEGFLEGIHFDEGSKVSKGQLLYTIESQPFEEKVAARMSEVAEAKTMFAKAESDLNRYKPLAAKKAVSASDLDAAQAQFDASKATVEAAEANLRAAKIELSYTRIHSPINGIIGRTLAREGDFVGRSPNPVILNVVSQTDMVRVQFFLTEAQYLQFARDVSRMRAAGNMELPREKLKLDLVLADGTEFPHPGTVDFIDRGIDPNTGAILVQATFPNPEGLIRPGQFARVLTPAETLKDGIIIPQRCVSDLQGQAQVYVVTDSGTVDLRNVKTGPKYHNFWVIREGLKGGDRVIYEGLQKVRPGAPVQAEEQQVEIVKSGR